MVTHLTLRLIGQNDFTVFEDGHPIGRIKLASGRHRQVWYWNVTIPLPGVPGGSSASFEEAKIAFRQGWAKSKGEIGPERLAAALELAEAARERLKSKGNVKLQ